MRKIVMLLLIPAAVPIGKKLMSILCGEPTAQSSSSSSHVTETPVVAEPPLGGEVSRELLDILVCPEDKGPLELVEEGKYLLNPRKGYRYPIRDGIPIMLIDEGKENQVPV